MALDNKKQVTSALSVADCKLDSSFRSKIKDLCGEDVLECYQCGECTAGCPAAFSYDISPNQIMRMAQLGMADDVLNSSSIWLCAGCETCSTRCPKGVALSKVMDACREIAIKEGKKSKQPAIVGFHKEFLSGVAKHGRLFEPELIGLFKAKTIVGDMMPPKETKNGYVSHYIEKITALITEAIQGLQMALKGKFNIIPHRIKGRKEVGKLFKGGK